MYDVEVKFFEHQEYLLKRKCVNYRYDKFEKKKNHRYVRSVIVKKLFLHFGS